MQTNGLWIPGQLILKRKGIFLTGVRMFCGHVRHVLQARLRPVTNNRSTGSLPGQNEYTLNPIMPFYPQGWTHNRLLNASGEDLMALSETQRSTLFDGLKATHGEDGFREIMQEMSRRYRARVEAAKSEETKQQERELLAPFVQTLNSVFRSPETEEWGKWGFVVFRTTPYGGEHETQWAEFRRRWDAVIEEGLAPHRGSLAKVDRAIDLLEFQWVEQPGLEGVDAAEVARYVSLIFDSQFLSSLD